MKLNKIKQMMEANILLESILQEIGDFKNIKEYPFTFDLEGSSFTLDTGEYVTMWAELLDRSDLDLLKAPSIFEVGKHPVYDLGYAVEDTLTQAVVTDFKQLIRILKTVTSYGLQVLEHIQELYPTSKPCILIFSQSKETTRFTSDRQKMLFYTQIVSAHIPSGYRVDSSSFLTKKGLIIQPTYSKRVVKKV